jgi:hypothetical protein
VTAIRAMYAEAKNSIVVSVRLDCGERLRHE